MRRLSIFPLLLSCAVLACGSGDKPPAASVAPQQLALRLPAAVVGNVRRPLRLSGGVTHAGATVRPTVPFGSCKARADMSGGVTVWAAPGLTPFTLLVEAALPGVCVVEVFGDHPTQGLGRAETAVQFFDVPTLRRMYDWPGEACFDNFTRHGGLLHCRRPGTPHHLVLGEDLRATVREGDLLGRLDDTHLLLRRGDSLVSIDEQGAVTSELPVTGTLKAIQRDRSPPRIVLASDDALLHVRWDGTSLSLVGTLFDRAASVTVGGNAGGFSASFHGDKAVVFGDWLLDAETSRTWSLETGKPSTFALPARFGAARVGEYVVVRRGVLVADPSQSDGAWRLPGDWGVTPGLEGERHHLLMGVVEDQVLAAVLDVSPDVTVEPRLVALDSEVGFGHPNGVNRGSADGSLVVLYVNGDAWAFDVVP